jgi:hypothetical protein
MLLPKVDWRSDPKQAARNQIFSAHFRLERCKLVNDRRKSLVVQLALCCCRGRVSIAIKEFGAKALFQLRDPAGYTGSVLAQCARSRSNGSQFHNLQKCNFARLVHWVLSFGPHWFAN